MGTGSPNSESDGGRWGRFVGPLHAEFLPDGREVRLLADFAYIDPRGRRWDAPAGAIVNGASIPRWAWRVIGGPWSGKYRCASVIHDVACDRLAIGTPGRKALASETAEIDPSHRHSYAAEPERAEPGMVHRVFYEAMRCEGSPVWRAWVMWLAVRLRGPGGWLRFS